LKQRVAALKATKPKMKKKKKKKKKKMMMMVKKKSPRRDISIRKVCCVSPNPIH